MSTHDIELPQGYAERPFDYSGDLYIEGQVRAIIEANRAPLQAEIEALRAERDALARENEAMRRCAIRYLEWLGVTTMPPDQALRDDMQNPRMCGDAALGQE